MLDGLPRFESGNLTRCGADGLILNAVIHFCEFGNDIDRSWKDCTRSPRLIHLAPQVTVAYCLRQKHFLNMLDAAPPKPPSNVPGQPCVTVEGRSEEDWRPQIDRLKRLRIAGGR